MDFIRCIFLQANMLQDGGQKCICDSKLRGSGYELTSVKLITWQYSYIVSALTNQLSNSMEQSPSREANSHSAGQEIS
jgi:hypothetical protein